MAELDEFALSAELFGHSQEVRSVLVLENGTLITGSRDHTIKVWVPATKGFELHKTLVGHQGAVASFAFIGGSPFFPPNAVIASAGYDKVIKIWDLEKDTAIATLTGHESEVCCLSTQGGRLLSGSWDSSARIWQGTECVSVLKHTSSVLAILGLETGEIITGTSSNEIKVWKNNTEVATLTGHRAVVRAIIPVENIGFLSASNDETVRLWSQTGEQLQEFHAMDEFIWALCVLKGSSAGMFACGGEERYAKVWTISGEMKQTIPHPSAIWSVAPFSNGDFVTGCADGVVRVWTRSPERVAEPEHIVEYTRRAGEAIETVRSGKVNGQAGEVAGVKYDVVINVDLGDGQTRKIGFNKGQNPWEVAQKFLWDHEIPQDYLGQVADFIHTNTSHLGPPDTTTAPASYGDPLTGGSRYVPQPIQAAGQFSDPLTGGGRYVPSYSQTPAPAPSFPSTPAFSSPAPASTPTFTSYPQTTPVLFDQSNFQAVYNKLDEFNTKLAASNPPSVLDANELGLLKKITDALGAQPPRTGVISQAEDQLLGKLLNWPLEMRFPALDLLRVYLLHSEVARKWSNNFVLIQTLLASLEGSNKVNAMLVFRGFANMFKNSTFEDLLWNNQETILESVASSLSFADTKPLRLSLVTLILNYSVLLHRKPKQEGKMQCLSLLAELLGEEKDDETMFRGLVALGTLIWKDDVTKALVEDFDLQKVIRSQLTATVAKNAKVATELKTFLKL